MVEQPIEPRSDPFDLQAAIHGVAERFRGVALAKGTSLDIEAGSTVPLVTVGDGAALEDVFTALLASAVGSTEAGEVVASVSCDAAIAGRALVHVEISDTGGGIDDAVMLRSRRMVEQMDGRFGCASEVGTGTSVWLTVPLDVSTPPTVG